MAVNQVLERDACLGMSAGRKPPGVRSEFFPYLFARGTAFVCDTSALFSLAQFLRVDYLVSAPIGFAVGTVVNYVASGRWVFHRRTLKNTPVES
jgi:putative flippase GtrA